MPKRIVFPASDDLWDEANNRFISMKEQTLVLEHSLKSLSKWEQKWKKPFISTSDERTAEEWLDYIRCMTLNPVNEIVYSLITPEIMQEILDYIADPMTATTFNDIGQQPGHKEVITSEILYYSMIQFGIPVEFEKWHLNTLITLIRVCGIKGGGAKKMSRAEAAAYQRSLNESRRARRR